MYSLLLLSALVAPDSSTIRGQYVEARTCDVFTGSCFANADTGLTGKNAVMAWKIDSGAVDGVKVDGLGVVVILSATDTLGLKQSGPGRSVIIVDEKATKTQREALVAFAKTQTGKLTGEVVAVHAAPFSLNICECAGESCATLSTGTVKIQTRCLNADHDKACGNETTMYPPLAKGVKANAALAVEHTYTGKDLNETWKDGGRRGAFVGSFVTR
ncbi:MAG: DUF1326 domain-containing protein [Planctomycetia bacterium]|nr:DUF1326 domain-containing protein [Planctomycetia bacterium]